MSPLTAFDVLELWEKGQGRHPVDRALLLLGASQSDQAYDHLADWTIGRRDASILKLRMATFGTHFNAYIDCPKCMERSELSFDGRVFLITEESQEKTFEVDNWRFRLPTTRDLVQLANEENSDALALRLLELCCINKESFVQIEWPSAIVQGIETLMSEADPLADIELSLICEGCRHTWQTAFDICHYFWEEIEVRAKRLLQEVHLLASAYGWSEQEILALSEQRRGYYLERVGL